MSETGDFKVTKIPLEEADVPKSGSPEVLDLSTDAGISKFIEEGRQIDNFRLVHERAFGAYLVSWDSENTGLRGARVAGRVIDFAAEGEIYDTAGIVFGSYFPTIEPNEQSPQQEALVLVLTPYDDFLAGPEK